MLKIDFLAKNAKKRKKNGSNCRKVCAKDDEEVDGDRLAEKFNCVDGKMGFIGTFDGRAGF